MADEKQGTDMLSAAESVIQALKEARQKKERISFIDLLKSSFKIATGKELPENNNSKQLNSNTDEPNS